jgi:hypothetical protein
MGTQVLSFALFRKVDSSLREDGREQDYHLADISYMARLVSIEELSMLTSELVHRVLALLLEVLSVIIQSEFVFLLITSKFANDIIRASVLPLLEHAN